MRPGARTSAPPPAHSQTTVFDTMTRMHTLPFTAIVTAVMAVKPGLLELTNAGGCSIVQDREAR